MAAEQSTKKCECGCGQFTNIAPRNNRKNGAKKGQPHRFLIGHSHRRAHVFDRFWRYVDPGPVNECWIWTGSLTKFGYGQIALNGPNKKPTRAHRVSWMIHNGPIPEGKHVLHHCDVRACVNPSHLWIGSNADNVRDKVAKCRQNRGETNPMSKITEDMVRCIRKECLTRPQKDVAADLGISAQLVSKIMTRYRWGWLK